MLPYSERERFSDNALHHGGNDELDYFFENAFHDMRFFLETITSHNAVFYTFFGDLEKHLYYISDNMKDDFGFESHIVHDMQEEWEKRIYGDKWRRRYRDDLQDVFGNRKDTQDIRYQVRDSSGRIIWVRWYARILWNDDRTRPLFMAGRVAKQSDDFICDPLTKLPLTSALEKELGIFRLMKRSCFLVGLSLNHIASININYSHELGDSIISDILDVARERLIDKVSAFRVSSTRYIFIYEHARPEDVQDVALELENIVMESYRKAHIRVDWPCSFAVAEFTPESNPVGIVKNLEMLMSQTDYSPRTSDIIRESGKRLCVLLQNESMSLALNNDVHDGMRNFEIYIQPIVHSENGRIAGGEALLRWKYNGSYVSPMTFIPILEREFLMPAAGSWILEMAVKYCSEVILADPDFLLTVNISRTQLNDDSFLDSIIRIFEKYRLDGRHIVFEITESTIDRYPEAMHKLEDICAKLGVFLAIDDFGTGYSSLHSLMEYRFNFLKIDRSVLLDIEKSYQNRSFTESLIWACHRNGMRIVMEGVETDNQDEIAKAIRCDLIQGYRYHKPAPADEIFSTVGKKEEN